ncbi:WhiB family transcriptional regulator [Gordonia otitidis]|uniref:4Fe-4S Wbl-type domain-containing protein n=1 Tax=Gordonia otitidis (strain DSM 44809 / CCUG 52243 / JCM 12355 / NBRC 100426 / IFM 10032) TaxID=1108044 RepID=H5TIW8_GORO1|nr:WhiB family transcriptional regulator [Gordonia otitidis]GAB33426.1 hypothetical protein GOOTI_065_00310 [Gordonia otitidis NBRC 100426]
MSRNVSRREGGVVDLLEAILRGTADLSGAACVGSPELFDPPAPYEDAADTRYRHANAEALCHRCPALDRCRDWAAQRRTDGSVLAAQVPRLPGRPRSVA